MYEDVVCSEVHQDQLYQLHIDTDIFADGGNRETVDDSRKAPARLRDFALCWMFFSLASSGFLEHLTMPTDGALSTKCLQTPCQ